MPHPEVTGFLTLTDAHDDSVHLLLTEPERMMHEPACKLFWLGSAETWLHALNWTSRQRYRWIIPDVYSGSSSLQRDWLRRYLSGEARAASSIKKLLDFILFHDRHPENNKVLLVGICINKLRECGSSVGRKPSVHCEACELLVRVVSALTMRMCSFDWPLILHFVVWFHAWAPGCVKRNTSVREKYGLVKTF